MSTAALDDAPTPPPTFLSDHDQLVRIAASRPEVISFAGGLPDPALFPRKELTRAFITAVSQPRGDALQYGWPEGSPGLRRYVAECLAERGARVDPDRVVITSGAQQAFFLALHAALRPGAVLGVEPTSYPGALEAARAFGAGLTSLEERAAAYYVMPSLSNPSGQPLSADVRASLLRRGRTLIIEDDAYADTTFSGKPPPPLLAEAPDRVVHIGTFSKTLCPGLRVGWVIAPERYLRRILRAKQNNDLQANGLSQSLLEAYLAQGTFAAHKQRARRNYQRRAKRLCAALRQHLPGLRFGEPSGGFSVWVESDWEVNENALFDAAVDEGVSLDLGGAFRRAPSDRLSFRLSYSAVAEGKIDEGVRRLARALQKVQKNMKQEPKPSKQPQRPRPTPASDAPAVRKSRPDLRTTTEHDARSAGDKDGNEGHARTRTTRPKR